VKEVDEDTAVMQMQFEIFVQKEKHNAEEFAQASATAKLNADEARKEVEMKTKELETLRLKAEEKSQALIHRMILSVLQNDFA
jgi:hypothetical protein